MHGGDRALFDAELTGPEGSPYQGGKFTITIKFPPKYPDHAPTVYFDDEIFHPNVFVEDGELILKELKFWDSKTTLSDILLAIEKVFVEPDLDRNDLCGNYDACSMYEYARDAFNEEASSSFETE